MSTAYEAEVLADNPIGYWRFEETSGSTVADEVGTNDGTVYGADLNVSGPGNLGSAASFDGTDDWIGFSAPPLTSDTSSATFEAWVNIPVDSPSCTIFSQADNSDSERWIQFVAHSGSDHKLRLIGRSSSTYDPSVANTPLDDGLWHHVVAVVDDQDWNGVTFYVDGVADGASDPDTDQPSIDTHDVAAIGALRRNNDDLADLMEGLVDEVAVYDYALSAARIQAHYDAAFEEPAAGTSHTPDDTTHSHTASAAALAQTHLLAVDSTSHGHTAETADLTQTHALTADDASHGHAADAVPVTVESDDPDRYTDAYLDTYGVAAAASADSTVHSHTVETADLTQTHALTADDTVHGHTVDPAALAQQHTLAADSGSHGHTSAAPTVDITAALTPDDTVHGHASETTGVTQTHGLAPDGAAHGHQAGDATLNIAGTATPDSAVHSHEAVSPTLTQQHTLTADNTSHTHTSTDATAAFAVTLTADSTSHTHTAASAASTVTYPLTVDGAVHLHTAAAADCAATYTLTPDGAAHPHTAGSAAFTFEAAGAPTERTYVVDAEDRVHTVAAENRTMTVPPAPRILEAAR